MGALGEQEATGAWTLSEEQIDGWYRPLELASFWALSRLSKRSVQSLSRYVYYVQLIAM